MAPYNTYCNEAASAHFQSSETSPYCFLIYYALVMERLMPDAIAILCHKCSNDLSAALEALDFYLGAWIFIFFAYLFNYPTARFSVLSTELHFIRCCYSCCYRGCSDGISLRNAAEWHFREQSRWTTLRINLIPLC